MNILILTNIYPSDNSIKGTFIEEQAKALSTQHQVFVFVFSINNKEFKPFKKYDLTEQTSKNLTIYRFTIFKTFPFLNQIKCFYYAAKVVKHKIINNKKIDIIHSHFCYPSGLLGLFLKKNTHIPLVITEHSSILEGQFRTFLHKIIVVKVLKKADVLIAVSKTLMQSMLKYVNRRIEIVPNVVDTSKFKLKVETTVPINIGFLGILNNHRKGLDLLIDAISNIKYKNYILHIGGEGKLLEYYKKFAKEKNIFHLCRFYGNIPYQEVPLFFSKIDIFVLPSRIESFGVVLLEAMACGIPVIATICGGPEDFVTNKVGIIVKPNDSFAITEAIDKMIATYSNYDSLKIREYVESNFGVAVLCNQLTNLYKRK
ncbi:MAG: hypothetical protein AUJ97_06605 [Bacteroidetes bacterium CG2_30_32_10]|nr:MAG: hypothetical protein AUJ97_06605 [Bacteroidetes bacterium CG2_30_32_10]